MSSKTALENNQQEIERLVKIASIDHVYSTISITTTAYNLFYILVIMALWSRFPPIELLTWLAVAVIVNIYRYYLHYSYRHGGRERKPIELWAARYTLTIFFIGCIWGTAGLVFFPRHSTALQIFMICQILALTMAFLTLTPYRKTIFYAFAIPSNSALIIRLFMEGGDYVVIAWGMVIFAVLVVFYAVRSGKTVREALYLRFENDFLVKQLSEEKEKAEEASRIKTQFLASASHDLRQPVHSLSLLTEALHNETMTSHGDELLQKLCDVTGSLSSLLSSLLDISRLDAGVVKPSLSTMPLESIVTVMENEFQAIARREGLVLRFHTCSGVISTDPDLLLDILRNLLSNAIRYTRFGGILLALRRRTNDLLIQVWDTGIGIPAADMETIFLEFNQLNNPERDRSKGLGLGLAICRRLTKLLGYDLRLRSQLGRGTVFELYMPNVFIKNKGGERRKGLQDLTESNGKNLLQGRTVLVIDDEKAVRESTAALLQSWGMRVFTADGLEQAQSQVAAGKFPIDIILADFRLREGMTGSVVINQLRHLSGENIPGVIITGDTDPQRIREARESGCTLLHKPIKPGQLRTVLGRFCDASKVDPGARRP